MRTWNIATQERTFRDMEAEIVLVVINGSVKVIVPHDRQEYIQVRSRSKHYEIRLSRMLNDILKLDHTVNIVISS